MYDIQENDMIERWLGDAGDRCNIEKMLLDVRSAKRTALKDQREFFSETIQTIRPPVRSFATVVLSSTLTAIAMML